MQYNVEKLTRRFARLCSARTTWESHWQELAWYCIPRRARFRSEWSPGAQLQQNLYDSTAIQSLNQFASGLHGVLTTPDQPWFSLILRNQPGQATAAQQSKQWLDEVGQRITQHLNAPESGFVSAIFDAWLDLGAFGTAILYVEERDGPSPLLCMHLPLHECYIAEGRDGRIDTVFRRANMPAEQVVEAWPEAISNETRRVVRDEPDKPISILHAVTPGQEGKFESVYLELDTQHVLEVGEYRQLPYLVARWVRGGGEVYARSPAMEALPDMRMINDMARCTLRAAQKQVDPPLMVPDDGYVLPIRTSPGSILYRRAGAEPVQPLMAGGRVELGLDHIERAAEKIMRAFNVDLFRLADSPRMTATEVVYRREEKLRLLGPVVGRLQRELLGPLIERVYSILDRAGALPPLPEQLDGEALAVRYDSPLAQAQMAARASGAEQLLGALGGLVQLDPSVVDVVDFDKALRLIAEARSAPAAMLRGEEEVAALRAQRAEQQQQHQQMAQAQQMAAVAQQGAGAVQKLAGAAVAGSEV